MKPRRWHSPYKSLLFTIIITASFFSSSQSYAQEWIVVTSEADSGPGSLRDAINQVNIGGSTAPNAIAFANNVQKISLQSNLPAITEPVLIDGLAIANVATPQNTIEGNCSLLPSPVDNPKLFSVSLRVTIDGSNTPNGVDPNDRWGLNLLADATIRGIKIKNISSPGNGSRAVGIVVSDSSLTCLVECCEISHLQNRAELSDSNDDNRAVGIEGSINFSSEEASTTASKCYIHHIKGGSIITCEGSSNIIMSGNAYGILNTLIINNNRIECINGGSISYECNNGNIDVTTGTTAGIFYGQDFMKKVPGCPIECNQKCAEESGACIQNNLICNLHGGSIITDQPNISVNFTVGIFFTNTNLNTTVIQNNVISSVHSGNITSSGNNTLVESTSTGGIFYSGSDNPILNCNTVSDITGGSTTLNGDNSTVIPPSLVGIFYSSSSGAAQCNEISNISGPTITVNGVCSSSSNNTTVRNITKLVPGGLSCLASEIPQASGIIAFTTSLSPDVHTISNNIIKNISGGKHVAQGSKSAISTAPTTGIYALSLPSLAANQNKISSIIGTELIAQAGSLAVIKQEGSVGLSLTGLSTIEADENHIAFVCEGRVKAAHGSIGANITNIDFSLPNPFKAAQGQQLSPEISIPYAPVITSGIAIASFVITGKKACDFLSGRAFCITNNTVDTVIGSSATGGLQPLGSIAVGIWLQPVPTENTRYIRSFESCADARQNNITAGTAFNNVIDNIIGGTQAPSYGIFLDGSAQFFTISSPINKQSVFFTLDKNNIAHVRGSKCLPTFDVSPSAITATCIGSGSEAEKTAFPFLPFEPTSGIYTLFGGCSTLSNNTITEVNALNGDARGITTAASSDMEINNNTASQIKGYGIFVGGAVVDNTLLPGTDSDLTLDSLASLRNRIYNNSTFDNTNKGIYLGLIDWSDTVLAIDDLSVCRSLSSRSCSDSTPENATSICGNHGQNAPCIANIICNTNGTVTIDASLKNTLPLTKFVIQFFRNSSNSVPHGEQHISEFDDPQLVFQTDFNGNAQARFTFVPLANIKEGDIISAHVTVTEDILSPSGNEFFGDTSEFSSNTEKAACLLSGLTQKPHTSNKPGYTNLLFRAPKEETAA